PAVGASPSDSVPAPDEQRPRRTARTASETPIAACDGAVCQNRGAGGFRRHLVVARDGNAGVVALAGRVHRGANRCANARFLPWPELPDAHGTGRPVSAVPRVP